MSTCIKYFIPEDGDDQNHPNICFVSSNQPNLGDLKKSFPVPGDYHFRFLRGIGDMKVWLDYNDDSLTLPITDGSIFAKVSRMTAPTTAPAPQSLPIAATNRESEYVNSTQKQSTSSTSQPSSAVKATPQQPASTSVKSPPAVAPPVRRNSEKLIKFDEDVDSPHPAALGAATSSSSDLLGFDTPVSSVPLSSASNVDLFGLETLQPTTASAMPSSSAIPPMQLRQPAPMSGGGVGLGGGPMGGSSINRMAGSNSPAPMSAGNYNPMAGMGQAPRGTPMGNYDAFSGLGAGSTSTRGGIPQQQSQYPGRGPMGQQQQQQRR